MMRVCVTIMKSVLVHFPDCNNQHFPTLSTPRDMEKVLINIRFGATSLINHALELFGFQDFLLMSIIPGRDG